MQYIVFLIGIVILFVLFLTSYVLKSLKESDRQALIELQERLNHEKVQAQLYKNEQKECEYRRARIDGKLLHIRLDLLRTEDDLKDVILRLLN